MRAVAIAAIGAIGAVGVGCRGIVGIEDIALVDGGAADGSVADGPQPDSATDAATDAGPTADANPASTICLDAGMDCPKCCHMNYGPQTQVLNRYLSQTRCVCMPGPNDCTTPCDAGASCTWALPPAISCASCIDHQSVAAGCSNADSTCLGDPQCAEIVVCMRSCFP